MTSINEATLVTSMAQAYNAHFIKNGNPGEALMHMMELSKLSHSNLRDINPNQLLINLSRGLNLSTRQQLKNFSAEVIVYLIKDVVGSSLSKSDLMLMTESKIKA